MNTLLIGQIFVDKVVIVFWANVELLVNQIALKFPKFLVFNFFKVEIRSNNKKYKIWCFVFRILIASQSLLVVSNKNRLFRAKFAIWRMSKNLFRCTLKQRVFDLQGTAVKIFLFKIGL